MGLVAPLRRSIPAWAGKPPLASGRVSFPAVYPRVGGGNPPFFGSVTPANGLSPRGRGKQDVWILPYPGRGSIPAWAGETPSRLTVTLSNKVYPRVGGETNKATPPLVKIGVYPRVGGGNSGSNRCPLCNRGLSPRGRGKQQGPYARPCPVGSIPAWAGETVYRAMELDGRKVYPRVGGGNDLHHEIRSHVSGLSPRGRGKPSQGGQRVPLRGSIPAWAGETTQTVALISREKVYPRVGGGNGSWLPAAFHASGLSPRGRGKLPQQQSRANRSGSIPAWAGET